ncbi:MAG TPA: efflux RND transporter permease subunit, partial [Polyangiaceae bacterium LLY-WYZ-14_1]|nr:efflux RND transporter permease subunit [Polyangiaceae bacterium LLY-WYZ-14_1]
MGFFVDHGLVVAVLVALLVAAGVAVAPFDWATGGVLPRDPVPVDAIPDVGDNQQIVFTEWPGRSPRDVEDQVTYPLTTALLGLPGVETVRSSSMFGFSSVYVIFEEGVDFYWSRSRILEKLAALPPGALPEDVRPQLGPDATALGQVFWYTLEGRDEDGAPVGGWDLQELRSLQDWTVR